MTAPQPVRADGFAHRNRSAATHRPQGDKQRHEQTDTNLHKNGLRQQDEAVQLHVQRKKELAGEQITRCGAKRNSQQEA